MLINLISTNKQANLLLEKISVFLVIKIHNKKLHFNFFQAILSSLNF